MIVWFIFYPSDLTASCLKMKEIHERKNITKGLDSCEGFPDSFGKLFDYVRALNMASSLTTISGRGCFEIYWKLVMSL